MNLLFSLYILAFCASQSFSATPLYWKFVEVPYTQSQMYTVLRSYTNSGRAPIRFLKSNTTADYTSKNWMDPCYERFIKYNEKFVVFWQYGPDMYCETLTFDSGKSSNTPTYAQQYLYRVEIAGTRCK